MTNRRGLFNNVLAFGALQALASSPGVARAVTALFNVRDAQEINPDFDAESYELWSGFLGHTADPVVPGRGLTRGGNSHPETAMSSRFSCTTTPRGSRMRPNLMRPHSFRRGMSASA